MTQRTNSFRSCWTPISDVCFIYVFGFLSAYCQKSCQRAGPPL